MSTRRDGRAGVFDIIYYMRRLSFDWFMTEISGITAVEIGVMKH